MKSTVTILFLGSSPSKTARIGLTKEVQKIDEQLRAAKYRDHFELIQQWEPVAENLATTLMRFEPDIVHFGGHGDADGGLVFETKSGQPFVAEPERIAEIVKLGAPDISCVILNACYSKVQADAIAENAPVVIGMGKQIPDEDAREFAEGFYSALGYGRTVGDAFEIAKSRVGLQSPETMPLLIPRTGIDPFALELIDIRQGSSEPDASELRRAEPSGSEVAIARAKQRIERLTGLGLDTSDAQAELLAIKRGIRRGSSLKPGDTLLHDNYVLVRPVGKGGFGQVWEAREIGSNRRVAVKVLHNQYANDASRLERFFRGARVMAQLDHPHVVNVLTPKAVSENFHFFVMEFIGGGNLCELVLANGITRRKTVEVVRDIASAVEFAHDQGTVHRDIKPTNILMAETLDHAYLTDFDLVKAMDTTGGTRTGAMGTFIYAAPEILDRPQDAGPAADIYGLGMTLAFCLNRQNLTSDAFRFPQRMVAKLDCEEVFKAIVRRAIAFEPQARFASAGDFASLLTAALDNPKTVELSVVEPTPEPGEPREIPARETWDSASGTVTLSSDSEATQSDEPTNEGTTPSLVTGPVVVGEVLWPEMADAWSEWGLDESLLLSRRGVWRARRWLRSNREHRARASVSNHVSASVVQWRRAQWRSFGKWGVFLVVALLAGALCGTLVFNLL